MFDDLANEYRLVLKGALRPLAGSAFQPTGFPDLGAAEFERPLKDGRVERSLLVESVQSMANRLEALGWDTNSQAPVQALSGLPYIEVRDEQGRFLTSSRLEPHRLAGSYLRKSTIDSSDAGAWLIDQLGVQAGVPTDWKKLYQGVFELDPMTLLHGVYFSDKALSVYGNPKIRRAVTAVIEAHGIQPVVSGGVKRDDVNPTHSKDRSAEDGFGFVPFGRTEYTAQEIELTIVVDLEQIRGYGLGEQAINLLTAIAIWEIACLSEQPLRLRTACDLALDGDFKVLRPDVWSLPNHQQAEADLKQAASQIASKAPIVVRYGGA